jgi:hypothetical protein
MKTTARKMSIFVVMVIATTTTLALGTSTAMAAKTHTHVTQLKSSGDDWFPTPTAFVASNTHTHHHNMHLMSSNGNHMTGISSIGSRNNGFPTGWIGGFSPTQYGSPVSPSYQQHFPTGTIAGMNGVNRGFGGDDDIPTGWALNN